MISPESRFWKWKWTYTLTAQHARPSEHDINKHAVFYTRLHFITPTHVNSSVQGVTYLITVARLNRTASAIVSNWRKYTTGDVSTAVSSSSSSSSSSSAASDDMASSGRTINYPSPSSVSVRQGCAVLWWACLSVCPHAYLKNCTSELHQILLWVSPMDVAQSSFGGVVMHCVLNLRFCGLRHEKREISHNTHRKTAKWLMLLRYLAYQLEQAANSARAKI